jgi:hypothetical protein
MSNRVAVSERSDTFTDGQYMSASEKRLVLKAWIRFLKGGMRAEDFTHRLYEHLIQHCSFIAHFSQHGFYDSYFTTGDGRMRFLVQFDPDSSGGSIEYGGLTHWLVGDYADINEAMREAARPYVAELREAAAKQQRAADVEHARHLLARHGIGLDA